MAVETLLRELVRLDGTDLYVTVGSPPKVSVDGRLVSVGDRALTRADLESLASELLADPAAFAEKPEADIALHMPDGERFRVNVYRQQGCHAFVARRIRAKILSAAELGLPEQLIDMAMAEKGLVLVTGATGSGKSTTLAAMVDHRNASADGHIVTIEDPIEFVYQHRRSLVSQREVGADTMCFADALRSALRQAPDVLSVGEIRDRETAQAALEFAETGHLVFGTLHAVNASQTLERILSMFPADAAEHLRMLLGLNLRGIVAQRLVPSQETQRALALEILVPTARIRGLVRSGDVEGVRDAIVADASGRMQSFDQCLLRLVEEGRVTKDVALTFADSPHDLRVRFSQSEAKNDLDIRIVH